MAVMYTSKGGQKTIQSERNSVCDVHQTIFKLLLFQFSQGWKWIWKQVCEIQVR